MTNRKIKNTKIVTENTNSRFQHFNVYHKQTGRTSLTRTGLLNEHLALKVCTVTTNKTIVSE